MSWTKQLFSSSIGRKFAMALSALFLIVFLLQHLVINATSTFSEQIFNELSHFMGTNPMVQFILQPILMLGVIFHFLMGFILEIKNRNARGVAYFKNNGAENSSWISRNMIWSGLFILFFLGFHFYDFWIPEMNYKYVEMKPEDPSRYYEEVSQMFHNPVRVVIYTLSFIFLSLHLLHGFQSVFQSIGIRHEKYTYGIRKLGIFYAILVPVGYVFIGLYHYINSLVSN